jgi:hypothetical protein
MPLATTPTRSLVGTTSRRRVSAVEVGRAGCMKYHFLLMKIEIFTNYHFSIMKMIKKS